VRRCDSSSGPETSLSNLPLGMPSAARGASGLSANGTFRFEYSPSGVLAIPGLTGFWARELLRKFNIVDRPAMFTYAGGVDGEGRPHGFGKWRDTQIKGETLKGLWQHGVPIGPFESTEQGTRFGFICVQIGFVTCCADAQDWDEHHGARIAMGPLHWGVAASETSINGSFYQHLPNATIIPGLEPQEGQSAAWVLEKLVQISEVDQDDQHIVVSARPNRRRTAVQLEIDGFEAVAAGASGSLEASARSTASAVTFAEATGTGSVRAPDELKRVTIEASLHLANSSDEMIPLTSTPAVPPLLRVVGWERSENEALLFIHGWTSGHKNAHFQLAQFLTLSRLGPHIKPFVFAWPCGVSTLSFPEVSKLAQSSTELHDALTDVVVSLAAAGIRRLHVFAHSMGARLMCSAVRQNARLRQHLIPLRDGASPPQSVRHGDGAVASGGLPAPDQPKRLELSTCTLLHPEHDLHAFVEQDYEPLRAHCPCVTIYLDTRDTALLMAEFVNRQPSLGKHPFALVHSAGRESVAAGKAQGQGVMSSLRHKLMHRVRGYDTSDDLDFSKSSVCGALDVDVIDTSWMDTNTQGPRHSYFNVNRWLIDDLAEVITRRRRAAARPHRLIKTQRDDGGDADANVYVFLAAPSHLGA